MILLGRAEEALKNNGRERPFETMCWSILVCLRLLIISLDHFFQNKLVDENMFVIVFKKA
jgi:hypothetical protein